MTQFGENWKMKRLIFSVSLAEYHKFSLDLFSLHARNVAIESNCYSDWCDLSQYMAS